MNTYCYRGVPLLGFAAFSGVGKTTVIKNLMPLLINMGLRVAIVKHAHHEFDIDYPGKDSFELRKAGASQIVVGSQHRRAFIMETQRDGDPELIEFLAHLDTNCLDLILVEGFRHARFPKIEINRKAGEKLLLDEDQSIIALVSDRADLSHRNILRLPLNDSPALASFVQKYSSQAAVDLKG